MEANKLQDRIEHGDVSASVQSQGGMEDASAIESAEPAHALAAKEPIAAPEVEVQVVEPARSAGSLTGQEEREAVKDLEKGKKAGGSADPSHHKERPVLGGECGGEQPDKKMEEEETQGDQQGNWQETQGDQQGEEEKTQDDQQGKEEETQQGKKEKEEEEAQDDQQGKEETRDNQHDEERGERVHQGAEEQDYEVALVECEARPGGGAGESQSADEADKQVDDFLRELKFSASTCISHPSARQRSRPGRALKNNPSEASMIMDTLSDPESDKVEIIEEEKEDTSPQFQDRMTENLICWTCCFIFWSAVACRHFCRDCCRHFCRHFRRPKFF